MNKRERIFNLLEGKPIDRTPTGFWLHFPESMHHGDAAIRAHMDFVHETDADILKVMNENLLWDGESKILSTADIGKFRSFGRKDKQFIDQMDIIKRIADQAQGEYPILATIHGLIASVFHATGFAGNYVGMGYGLSIFCREKPELMKGGFVIDVNMTDLDVFQGQGNGGINLFFFFAASSHSEDEN